MRDYLIRSNKIMEQFWPDYYWKLDSSNTIFLTFDDGPHQFITPEVLSILEQYNATATFFCIGKNAQQHPHIVNNIISQGHTIGNHTFDHKNGWYTDNRIYIKNVLKAETLLPTLLFRPPYGRIKNKQAQFLRRKGYKIIMWSLLTGDFDINISPENCFKNIEHNIKAGDIVVFHDSEKAYERMIYALPKLLELCIRNNWQVKALPFQ